MSAEPRFRAAAGVVEREFSAPGGKRSEERETAGGVTTFAAMPHAMFALQSFFFFLE